MAHAYVDWAALEDFLADIEQYTVAQVDGIVQAQEHQRGVIALRKIFEDALTAEGGLRVLADGAGAHVFGRAALRYRNQRVDISCRERHNARRSVAIGHERGEQRVHGPSEMLGAGRSEL